MSSREIKDGDIVSYPIYENTKNQRMTIGKISGAGIALWIDGPEISTTVSDISKCTLLSSDSKKAQKMFKKYSEKFEKLDMDEIGFDSYQEKAESLYNMYIEKFEELNN